MIPQVGTLFFNTWIKGNYYISFITQNTNPSIPLIMENQYQGSKFTVRPLHTFRIHSSTDPYSSVNEMQVSQELTTYTQEEIEPEQEYIAENSIGFWVLNDIDIYEVQDQSLIGNPNNEEHYRYPNETLSPLGAQILSSYIESQGISLDFKIADDNYVLPDEGSEE